MDSVVAVVVKLSQFVGHANSTSLALPNSALPFRAHARLCAHRVAPLRLETVWRSCSSSVQFKETAHCSETTASAAAAAAAVAVSALDSLALNCLLLAAKSLALFANPRVASSFEAMSNLFHRIPSHRIATSQARRSIRGAKTFSRLPGARKPPTPDAGVVLHRRRVVLYTNRKWADPPLLVAPMRFGWFALC